MRLSFLLSLVLTIAIGSTYWYETTKHICPIPVGYQLGTIDESFSITPEQANEAIEQAVAIWENGVGTDLFAYDDQADLTVSFIFDDRQARADAQRFDQEQLDLVSSQNEEIRSTITQLQQTYERMQTTFEARKAAFDEALVMYNQEVRQANDRGGATTSEFEELAKTQETLEDESQALQVLAEELNDVAAQLNELSTEGNRLVRTYNQQVDEYNSQYGGGEQFTQGDYTGEEIHIYKFSSQDELVTVLAHEFGHALGIGHVEGEGSLMYYLLAEDEAGVPGLSPTDLEAYNTTCQTDAWDFKLRSFIRSIIS